MNAFVAAFVRRSPPGVNRDSFSAACAARSRCRPAMREAIFRSAWAAVVFPGSGIAEGLMTAPAWQSLWCDRSIVMIPPWQRSISSAVARFAPAWPDCPNLATLATPCARLCRWKVPTRATQLLPLILDPCQFTNSHRAETVSSSTPATLGRFIHPALRVGCRSTFAHRRQLTCRGSD